MVKKTMNLLSDNIYFKKNNKNYLYYIEQPSFNELIEVIYKSNLCITCHGSPTHISSSFDVKTIDIVDGSKILIYRAYTKHLQNYNEVMRGNANETTKKILSLKLFILLKVFTFLVSTNSFSCKKKDM